MHNSNLLRNHVPVSSTICMFNFKASPWTRALPEPALVYITAFCPVTNMTCGIGIPYPRLPAPSFLHSCVRAICIYHRPFSVSKSKVITKLLTPTPQQCSVPKETKLGLTPKEYLKRLNCASHNQRARPKDTGEKALLNGNCHRHLVLYNGCVQLSSFYFALCFILHRYLAFSAYLPSIASRAETPCTTPGIWTIPITYLCWISAQFIILQEEKSSYWKPTDDNFTKTLLQLTFLTLCLYHFITLHEFTKTVTSKYSRTLLNHVFEPKTHSLLSNFADQSTSPNKTSHPPMPQSYAYDNSWYNATVQKWVFQKRLK